MLLYRHAPGTYGSLVLPGISPWQWAMSLVPLSLTQVMPSVDGIMASHIGIKSQLSCSTNTSPALTSQMFCFLYVTIFNLVTDYPLTLQQLQCATHRLAAHSFRPGTTKYHAQQASTFIKFCDIYHLPFIQPSVSTVTSYVTYLTQHFQSSASVHNYISRVRFMHRELGLIPEVLDSFPVASLLRAADITMRVPPLRHLPILLPLLH